MSGAMFDAVAIDDVAIKAMLREMQEPADLVDDDSMVLGAADVCLAITLAQELPPDAQFEPVLYSLHTFSTEQAGTTRGLQIRVLDAMVAAVEMPPHAGRRALLIKNVLQDALYAS